MKVLIFDSDMLARHDLKQVFYLHAIPAVCTGDQRRALSMISSGDYSLVVAGVSQYAEDISSFVEALRTAPQRPPVIVGVAYQAETMHLRTVSAYVDFPISPRDLNRIVEAAITNDSTRAVMLAAPPPGLVDRRRA
ncbi:hypothetical protein AB2N08_15430 [Massilia aurea]|uniref:hypothetical protein n=1 Tax=Massilia aurea TaxID=373040 RepID=UPI00346347A6